MNNEHFIFDTAFANLAEKAPIQLLDVIRNIRRKSYDGREIEVDAIATLSIDNQLIVFEVEVKNIADAHTMGAIERAYNRREKPFLLVAGAISPIQRNRLKDLGINYLDSSGNCYIKEKGLIVYVTGEKSIERRQNTNTIFSKNGLKVIFFFLNTPNGVNATYRQIAESSGVALGSITRIIEDLQRAGFIINIDSRTRKLDKYEQLLAEWISGYQKILKPSLLMGKYFVRPETLISWMKNKKSDNIRSVWGGEPAAETLDQWLRAEHFSIYTLETELTLRTELLLLNREDANLSIYQRFWGNAAEWDEQLLCPPLLIYADLVESDDPRNIETAKRIFDKFISNGTH